METAKEREHSLALKVMRLTKPSLMVSHPILKCSSNDLCFDAFNEVLKSDVSVLRDLQDFSLSPLLTLPQNFGNIFLGETFSCYISIHNDSKECCRDILVKADLQTSSQRLTLSGTNSKAVDELPPDESIDDVIHHEVKELGTHILACAVSYSSLAGEKLYFRKFFKFHVLKPLDVKTKFYNTEVGSPLLLAALRAVHEVCPAFRERSAIQRYVSGGPKSPKFNVTYFMSDDVYLEAQIQNITPGPIYLEKVSLEPSPKYTVCELNTCKETGVVEPSRLVFGEINCMAPNDIRQYLYNLRLRVESSADIRQFKSNTLVGKLDIVWKTNMGERGRLQTSPLQRIAPGSGDIKVSVVAMPEAAVVGSTIDVDFKVTNCSERTMDLLLQLHNNMASGILWSGVSGRPLGKLEPCSSTILHLSVIAIRTGLLTMSGLRLMDTFLKRVYEHDEVAQVFIYRK